LKQEIRYRVTGSLFLLAVAVICLPMLLDGAGVSTRALPELPPMEETPPPGPPAEPEPPVPESDFLVRVQALRSAVDDDGFLAESGTRFGEPVLTASREDTEVWAIQVASFGNAANAEGFRERLREDGYEAFISTAKAQEKVLSRVAVGPFLDRERAESLRSELSARYDLGAQLMAFSN
jgi:DedD protein